jgi:hypothetical protein
MDSILNHPSAKRLHPSTSSSNLAGMTRSITSRTLAASTLSTADERSSKRLKPSSSRPANLARIPPSTSSKKLVDGLRAAGWADGPTPSTSVSLSSSIRAGSSAVGSGKAKSKGVREDLKPVQEGKEQRKRQLEMAKARRKSQAASGLGLAKRRPSMAVGRAFFFPFFPFPLREADVTSHSQTHRFDRLSLHQVYPQEAHRFFINNRAFPTCRFYLETPSYLFHPPSFRRFHRLDLFSCRPVRDLSRR